MYYATVQVVVTATTSAAPYGIREGARKVVPSAKQVEEYIGALARSLICASSGHEVTLPLAVPLMQ